MKGSRVLLLIGLGLLVLWLVLFLATAIVTLLLPLMWRIGLGFLAVGAVIWLIETIKGEKST